MLLLSPSVAQIADVYATAFALASVVAGIGTASVYRNNDNRTWLPVAR
ncbi:hypothetical protein ACFCXL_16925 [[Kitasatospora] papulosa]